MRCTCEVHNQRAAPSPIRSANNATGFECQHCVNTSGRKTSGRVWFVSAEERQAHIEARHAAPGWKHFRCKTCMLECENMAILQRHLMDKHTAMYFSLAWRHGIASCSLIHTHCGRHRCEICGQRFGDYGWLLKHQQHSHQVC